MMGSVYNKMLIWILVDKNPVLAAYPKKQPQFDLSSSFFIVTLPLMK